MKKVIYSVSRYRKGDIEKNTGIGYITDRDLVIACISKMASPISASLQTASSSAFR